MEYDTERIFTHILDLCQDLDVNTLESLIANIEVLIEDKQLQVEDLEDYIPRF